MHSKTLIIHTGGTIGMVPSSQGLSPKEQILEQRCRELLFDIEFDWIELTPLIDSSALTTLHWQSLISEVLNASLLTYARIVILHGTDSLSYTAAALTLALLNQDCPPIVITGAQKSIFEIDTITDSNQENDALENILHSITCPIPSYSKVQVSFNQKLINPMSCFKQHTEAFNGFSTRQLNAPEITHPFTHKEFSDDPIQIELCQPALTPTLNKHTKAVVILAYGSGNYPPSWQTFLLQCHKQNIPLVLTSQVEQGGLDLERYHTVPATLYSSRAEDAIPLFYNNFFSLAATLTSIRYCLASNTKTSKSLAYLFDQILL